MQGSPNVIELLNRLLTMELTAINQYFLHSRMCANWGYARLAAQIREIAFEEMHDAEEYVDRVLFLEGVPNLQRLNPVQVGETVAEQLELGLRAELDAIRALTEGAETCASEGDTASREFLASKLAGEEKHLDWHETQLSLLRSLGEAAYLSQQLRE